MGVNNTAGMRSYKHFVDLVKGFNRGECSKVTPILFLTVLFSHQYRLLVVNYSFNAHTTEESQCG